jgi:hypothetical protein
MEHNHSPLVLDFKVKVICESGIQSLHSCYRHRAVLKQRKHCKSKTPAPAKCLSGRFYLCEQIDLRDS